MRRRIAVMCLASSFLCSSPAVAQFTQQGSKLVGLGVVGPGAAQGQSVALSADGNTAIIGGPGDDTSRGAVWIFTRSGSTWTQQGPKLAPSGLAPFSVFGSSVALSADGNTAVIGGYGDDDYTGAVWIFVRSGGTWTQQGPKLVGTDVDPHHTFLGMSVAIAANGNTVIVGGNGGNGAVGGAWVFTRTAGMWTQQGSKLVGTGASTEVAGSKQGDSVALSADGNTAVVGGSVDDGSVGAAWFFGRIGSTWTQQGSKVTGTMGTTVNSRFGNSAALSADGRVAAIGGYLAGDFAGAVWMYKWNGSAWAQNGPPLVGSGATSSALQGSAVALSSNGAVVLEGGAGDNANAGATWVFTRTNAGSYTQLGDKLVGSGEVAGATGAGQGRAVALSADGRTAIVGGGGDDTIKGAAWIFTATPPALPPHATADFDGDHKADVTLVNANGAWTTLQSTTNFGSSSTVNVSGEGFAPVIGDFDGDGKQDPAIYNRRTGDWIIKQSSTNYATTMTANWGYTVWVPVPGDYDGDGKTDLAVAWTRSGAWDIIRSSDSSYFRVTLGGTDATPVPGLDFDGDSISDVAVYRRATGVWSVLTSSSAFTTGFSVSWGGPGYWLVPGDYDGDRKTDLALYEPANGWWHVLESSTGYTTAFNVNWGGLGYRPVPADYDGDGRIDLGLYQQDTGSFYALLSATSYTTSLTRALGGSRLDVPISTAITFGGDDVTRASDHDGDSVADITVYSGTSGIWFTLTSGSHYGGALSRTWGGPGFTPVNGDFDGDGHPDLGLYDPLSGDWQVRLSSTNFTTTLSKNAGGPGWIPVPADYDGDRKTDFVAYNTTTGQWHGLKSGSNYSTTLDVNLGGTGYQAVPGDYDGDGWADVAVYQSATGSWSVLMSSFTVPLFTWNVGGAGWVPVQADYDGDGVTDFAVYNTTTGRWYALKSSTGLSTTVSVGWGGTGYIPVKGDYDGDGKADLATYVQSTGYWYILLSGANYTTTIVKNAGGVGWIALPSYP